MQMGPINPNRVEQSADLAPSKARKENELKEACQQFESLFLNQLLSQMRKSIPKSEGGGQEQEMYNSMMDEEMAKNWSKGDGIGLANILFQQMKDLG
jgi:flagellar protein FlgJ